MRFIGALQSKISSGDKIFGYTSWAKINMFLLRSTQSGNFSLRKILKENAEEKSKYTYFKARLKGIRSKISYLVNQNLQLLASSQFLLLVPLIRLPINLLLKWTKITEEKNKNNKTRYNSRFHRGMKPS